MHPVLRNVTFAALTTLSLTVLAPIARAEEMAIVLPTLQATPSTPAISPFGLVNLAYQGYFKSQGTPASQALIREYQLGQLTAEDLVKSAIQANWLSAATLEDTGYLAAVNQQLQIQSTRN